MKQTINRFNYMYLRNEAHVQMHDSFVELVAKYNGAENLSVKPLYDVYLPLFEQEKAALDMIVKSGITDEIISQDMVRDRIFRGLTDAVKSALNHFNDEKRNAAEKLNLILKHYGNIGAKPLDQETAAIEDLNRELTEVQNAAYVSTLGIEDWLTQLVQENKKFDRLMMDRYAEQAARPTVNMKAIRTEVDRAFRDILNLLEAFTLTVGPEANAGFIAELNVITQRYENILAQQKGARQARKDKENNALAAEL